jgi:hypothetical protein
MSETVGNLFCKTLKKDVNRATHYIFQIGPVNFLLDEVPGKQDLSKSNQYLDDRLPGRD